MEAARAELTGTPTPDRLIEAVQSQLQNRRLAELIAAVWEHERRTRDLATGQRPHDAALYGRLRRILGGHSAAEAR
jgi:hypothetical protein